MGSNKVTKKDNKNAKKDKVTKKVVKKEETPETSSSSSESSSSSSESSSEEEEEETETKSEDKEKESESSSSSSEESESSDEEEEKEEEEKADENSASESSSSSSEEDSSEASDSSSEEEEEKSMEVDETENKNNKRKADTSDDDNENPAKAAKTEEKFTVWCGGLNWEATVEQIKEHFAQCGEIVDVRLRMDNATGKNKGFCHVDFATKEGQEAALALSNTEFLGRTIRLDSADGNNRQRTKKDENYGPRTNKVFCANLNRDFDEESHRNSLNEHFGKFGKIVDIRIPYDRESGAMKGIAYIEFENPDQAEAAVTGMNGVEVNGRPLRTDYSGSNDRDRVNQRGGRGGPRGGRGGFRGGRGGGRGGFRGGRGGFRGRD